MIKSEIAITIKQAKQYLKDNYGRMTPHQRDELKFKTRQMKDKLKS